MKTNIKKLISMGLILTLSFSVLSACDKGGTVDPSASPEASATGGVTGDGNKKVLSDLGGMEVILGDWYTAEETEKTTQYLKDTDQYIKDCESKYNYKWKRMSIDSWGEIAKRFVNEVTADNPSAQIYALYETSASQPIMNGLAYNLSAIETLDLSEDKWNERVVQKWTVGGNCYGTSDFQEPRAMLFFNKRLFEEAGIDPEEPYNLQASGEWTWDKFEEYCKLLTKDTDGDGQIDQYAVGSFGKVFLPMMAATNGANFVDKKDGKFTNELGTENFLESMNKAMEWMNKGYIKPNPEGAAWDWFKAAFRDCEVAMQVAEAYETSEFQRMDDDYGAVLFPAGPKGEMATIPMDNVYVIPSCLDKDTAEKVGQAYDLYAEPTPGYESDEVFKNKYYQNFCDERSIDETLMMTLDPQYQCISYLPEVDGLDYGDFSYGIYAGAATPKEEIETITPVWDTKIAEANKNLEAFAAKQ